MAGTVAAVGVALAAYFVFLRPEPTSVRLQNAIAGGNIALSPSCSKVGLINYIGARSDLYDCLGDYGSWDHCFVFTSGQVFDVTANVRASVKLQKLTGTYDATRGFACAR